MDRQIILSVMQCELGIDLSEVDIAILSHGYYDHGGLERFMHLNKKAQIYMSHCVFRNYYH